MLTSGQQKTALEGAKELAVYQNRVNESLVIMAGGGVRAANIKELIQTSGVTQVHARATDPAVFKELVDELRKLSPKPDILPFIKPQEIAPEETKAIVDAKMDDPEEGQVENEEEEASIGKRS